MLLGQMISPPALSFVLPSPLVRSPPSRCTSPSPFKEAYETGQGNGRFLLAGCPCTWLAGRQYSCFERAICIERLIADAYYDFRCRDRTSCSAAPSP